MKSLNSELEMDLGECGEIGSSCFYGSELEVLKESDKASESTFSAYV